MIRTIKNSFDIEPINEYGVELAFYADLNLKEVVTLDELTKENASLIRFPYKEELYPYGRAMSDYLDENNLDVPEGERAKSFLANRGLLDDFYYSFWQEGVSELLLDWLVKHNLALEPSA